MPRRSLRQRARPSNVRRRNFGVANPPEPASSLAAMELVDFLMARGRLDAVHRERVIALRRERGESESVIITRLGMIGEREMAEHLAEFFGIPLAREADYPVLPVPA